MGHLENTAHNHDFVFFSELEKYSRRRLMRLRNFRQTSSLNHIAEYYAPVSHDIIYRWSTLIQRLHPQVNQLDCCLLSCPPHLSLKVH